MNTEQIIISVIGLLVFGLSLWAAFATGGAQTLTRIVKLVDVISIAVKEADKFQHYTDAQKYKYVADIASKSLSDWGISVPADVVQKLIEGAVKLIHRQSNTIYSGPD